MLVSDLKTESDLIRSLSVFIEPWRRDVLHVPAVSQDNPQQYQDHIATATPSRIEVNCQRSVKAQGGIGGNRALAKHDLINPAPIHANINGQTVLA
jgi:hypothetical protein